ncbi:MAG: sialidase family protein, partial [Dehalococcoidia bacterium]
MEAGKRGVDRCGLNPGKISLKSRVCVICLAVAATLTSLLVQPPIALAATPSSCVLKWGTVDTPGGFPQRNDIRYGSEINALAASPNGMIIYALDIPNSSSGLVTRAGIWRSGDGGISWSQRPTQWLARTTSQPAPVFPVAALAIAPDNPDLVAAVCMSAAGDRRREVYYSEDGGTNWYYSGAVPYLYGPDEQIGSIVISAPYTYRETQVRDIIVGSRNPDSVSAQEGEVYVLRYPGIAGWQAQGFTGGDILALQPSPSYAVDASLVVTACTLQRTYINLGSRDIGANACYWNTAPGYPVELCTPDQAGGSSSGKNRVITGSLALPADFDGNSGAKRIIFSACDSNGSAAGTSRPLDDMYRLNDTIVTRLAIPTAKPRISSIAYSGSTVSGKLLAGCVGADRVTGAANVFFTGDPLA